MIITLTPTYGGPRGYTVAGAVLRWPGGQADLSGMSNGDTATVAGAPISTVIHDGDLRLTAQMHGISVDEQRTITSGDIGVGAPGGPAATVTITTAADIDAARLAEWRNATSIGKAEFLENAAAAGLMTIGQAKAAARGTMPAHIEALLAGLSQAQRDQIELYWAGNATVSRASPLITTMQAAMGLPDATVDTIFGRSSS